MAAVRRTVDVEWTGAIARGCASIVPAGYEMGSPIHVPSRRATFSCAPSSERTLLASRAATADRRQRARLREHVRSLGPDLDTLA